ncbi:Uncharacterised protein [Mycobacterium tuberculosis]|uniref:Uncharacterized protein n=1 Tax=Mycobacterium tuberculosis TaxID=1773 RepID=A0A0U0QIW1_MYCTX|nr:Uncharacterised protein [Mycobacterium tuberculosis]COV38750.1 Uncharacterised protein [Mycobacterium tuberculosis]
MRVSRTPPDVKPSDSPANPHRSGLATLCRPKGCNTRPPKLTSTPRSRAAGSAATASASRRLAGPSAPGASALSMAPVNTTGRLPA